MLFIQSMILRIFILSTVINNKNITGSILSTDQLYSVVNVLLLRLDLCLLLPSLLSCLGSEGTEALI